MTAVSNNHTHIAALERVERMRKPNHKVHNIWYFLVCFLREPKAKTGQNAIKKNQKLIGLSKRNWFLIRPLLISV